MKLVELSIENFRSITSINEVKIASIQALLGENNAGKSNLLYAIECFLSQGAGGISESDFQNPDNPIVIKAKFKVQSPHLQKA